MALHFVLDGTVVSWDPVTRVMQIGDHCLVISSAVAVSMPEQGTVVTAIRYQEEGEGLWIAAELVIRGWRSDSRPRVPDRAPAGDTEAMRKSHLLAKLIGDLALDEKVARLQLGELGAVLIAKTPRIKVEDLVR